MNQEAPDFQLPTDVEVTESARKSWTFNHSAGQVIGIYDKYLRQRATLRPDENLSIIQGFDFIHPLADFTADAKGLAHAQFFFGAIDLLGKHNPNMELRAIAHAFLAVSFNAKGLKTEAQVLARIIQKTHSEALKDRPTIKELIFDILAA